MKLSRSVPDEDTSVRRSRGSWALVVTFWAFSLLFGLAAASGSGWGFPMLLAWLLLACATMVVTGRRASWQRPA
jgi:amino acid transporter